MVHTAFIGLGSNLENPVSQLQRAFLSLERLTDTCLVARSSLYRSAPLDCPEQADVSLSSDLPGSSGLSGPSGLSGLSGQPDYINAVAEIATGLAPNALLQALLHIEHRHGRERSFRNAPRTLDLDVLLYDDLQLHEDGLTIPHPQMHKRAFVLRPLLEIAPGISIPGVGNAALALAKCHGQVLDRMPDRMANAV
jgi:2-amino-4-hydroxy-6-hydroxymethyldihydropteridine diphosphokinase